MVPVCILITLLLFSSLALTVGLQKPFARQVPDKVNIVLRESNCSYGYINRQGQLVIPARFYRAGDFSEGLASVAVVNPGIETSPESHLYARREGRLWGIHDIRY